MLKPKALTLAEVLVVLTVIGVLSAVILPIGMNSTPNERISKFKKANNTLNQVMRELVSGDTHYSGGDLGIQSNRETPTAEYFCNAIASLLSTKEVSCTTNSRSGTASRLTSDEDITSITTSTGAVKRTVSTTTMTATKKFFDDECKKSAKTWGKEIVTTDGITYYQAGSMQLGHTTTVNGKEFRYFSPPGQFPANIGDQNGMDIAYKIYCIDVDGIPSNVTTTDCKNECPFGFGIRANGKILTGERADQWLAKNAKER